MKLTVIVEREGGQFSARCREVDRSADGASAEEAIANLRLALERYYTRVRSIAPPEKPEVHIELVVIRRP
jgi:predicted RNase H-like HicB family nuclease